MLHRATSRRSELGHAADSEALISIGEISVCQDSKFPVAEPYWASRRASSSNHDSIVDCSSAATSPRSMPIPKISRPITRMHVNHFGPQVINAQSIRDTKLQFRTHGEDWFKCIDVTAATAQFKKLAPEPTFRPAGSPRLLRRPRNGDGRVLGESCLSHTWPP